MAMLLKYWRKFTIDTQLQRYEDSRMVYDVRRWPHSSDNTTQVCRVIIHWVSR